MLTISIINYHGRRDTEQCIRELSAVCSTLNYRVLVRDNSEPSETAMLRGSLCDLATPILFFDSPDNPGFGRGHNLNFQAVEHRPGDVFLILNPDIHFPDSSVIARMLGECIGKKILSCVIETAEPVSVWFSGGLVGKISGIPSVRRRPLSSPVCRVDFVTGCCLMIPSELFAELGGFDESYFMYSEDVDLCLRSHGHQAEVLVVNASIVHRVGSGEKGTYSDLYLYEGTMNRLRCLRRHKLGVFSVGIVFTVLKYGIARTIQLAIHSQSPFRQIRAAWRGILDGLFVNIGPKVMHE